MPNINSARKCKKKKECFVTKIFTFPLRKTHITTRKPDLNPSHWDEPSPAQTQANGNCPNGNCPKESAFSKRIDS